MRADTITLVDNRTGKSYELPVEHGAIRTTDLRQIRTGPDDFGLLAYDPAFMNTAACKSRITYIDGERGILEYRGYPIEQLAERSTFLETAYLLLHGELPTGESAERLGMGDHASHVDPREPEEIPRRVPPRCSSHGDAGLGGRGALDVLPECQEPCRRRRPAPSDCPDDRQDAYPGGIYLPAQPRAAIRLSRQRSWVRGELPQHDVQGDGAEALPESRSRAGDRRALHPPRGP